MVKTRASGDSSAHFVGKLEPMDRDDNASLLDEQENEGVSVAGSRSTKKGSDRHAARSLPLSNDTNRCNSVAESEASGSLFSASTKNETSDTSIGGTRSSRHAYRRIFVEDNDARDVDYASTQNNVRKSTRVRKPKFESMNENAIETSPYFSYDGETRRRSLRHDRSSRRITSRHVSSESESDDDAPRMRSYSSRTKVVYEKRTNTRSREMRILGLEEAVADEDEGGEDMYSRIKKSRRKVSRDNGAYGDNEDTDIEVNGHLTDGDETLKETVETDELTQVVEKDTEAPMEDDETAGSEEVIPQRTRRRPPTRRVVNSPSESEGPRKYDLRTRRQVMRSTEYVLPPKERREPRNYRTCAPFSRGDYVNRNKKKMFSRNSSDDPSSSSDETSFQNRKARSMNNARSQCLPMNLKKKDLLQSGILNDRQKIGASLADIDPMTIDKSVQFDSIGGLDKHVQSLKEMILFPLLYPGVFEKFKISPPRGVLFHGPPGTGKTLVARALANECSTDGKKVAFFMRKGADCLSKWVGESERQLRLLFDQAYSMRPSIIFFDEIDGIAPVRSTRQDQIHSSIVSTLLALMDGLDNRGEVVIIGATNRIDAIDPALRRPGRFDREFFFPLPSQEARHHILTIHTKEWEPKLPDGLVSQLAMRTVNYCGADLKALCAEAALLALRRRYPQIYSSKNKLLLNVNEISVQLRDFLAAIKKIVPATQRATATASRPVSLVVKPLLVQPLKRATELICSIFPHARLMTQENQELAELNDEDVEKHLVVRDESNGSKASNSSIRWPGIFRPRFLLYGSKDSGQSSHLAPAILHDLEHLANLKLDLCTLHSVTARTPEESLANLFSDACKRLPAILYVPHINTLWSTLSDTLRVTLQNILEDMESSTPLLVFATSDVAWEELPEDLQDIFCRDRSTLQTMEMPVPSHEERTAFFEPLFKNYALKSVSEEKPRSAEELEVLPEVSAPEVRKLSDLEVKKLRKKEEHSLRELRLFLRDILGKIIKDKRFSAFVKPVDEEDAPDYYIHIKNPMDLESIMQKVDYHKYECAQQFLEDIELIVRNALEYNPIKDSNGKQIRHSANGLKDYAYALIETEMDSDFETMCQDIHLNRLQRGEAPQSNCLPVINGAAQEPSTLPGTTTPPEIAVAVNEEKNDEDTEIEEDSVKSMDVSNGSGTTEGSAKSTTTRRAPKRRFGSSGKRRKRVRIDKSAVAPEPEVIEVNDAEEKVDADQEEEIAPVEEKMEVADVSEPAKAEDVLAEPLKEPAVPEEPLPVPQEIVDAKEPEPEKEEIAAAKEPEPAKDETVAEEAVVSNGDACEAVITPDEPAPAPVVIIDERKLLALLARVLNITKGVPIEKLERLYWSLFRIIQRSVKEWDRTHLVKELRQEVDNFERQNAK